MCHAFNSIWNGTWWISDDFWIKNVFLIQQNVPTNIQWWLEDWMNVLWTKTWYLTVIINVSEHWMNVLCTKTWSPTVIFHVSSCENEIFLVAKYFFPACNGCSYSINVQNNQVISFGLGFFWESMRYAKLMEIGYLNYLKTHEKICASCRS